MDGHARIDGEGPSPLQRLKNLAPEEREFLVEQKKKLSAAKLIAQIEARHGIVGLTAPRLSDFLRWMVEQREIRAANDSVANIRQIFSEVMPGAGAEETHKFLLSYLTAAGFGKTKLADKEKTLRFVTVETRKAVDLGQKERRLALLEKQAEKALKVLDKAGLSEAEQNKRIREIFKR